jgi:threonine/homoserine/homoserine lactone efflux protein
VNRIPNAVAFMFFLGLTVTVTSALTAPAGTRVLALVAGVITSVIVSLVVAGGVWLRTRLRRARRSNRGDGS